jgi:hypothetical protein
LEDTRTLLRVADFEEYAEGRRELFEHRSF